MIQAHGHSSGKRSRATRAGVRSLVAIAVATALVACNGSSNPEASSQGSGASGQAASRSWSFVDDRPVEVTLDTVPQRIVAYETAAAALMGFGIPVVGVFGSAPLDDNPYLDGLDLTGVEDVGSVYGEVNLEAIAALDPDLIVTTAYIDTRTGSDAASTQLGGLQGAQARQQIEAIAPVVGIDELLPTSSFIQRFEDLAVTLGADLDSPAIAEDRERYEDAKVALRAALAANPDLSVLAVYGNADSLYVAQPGDWQDLPEFQQLGMEVIDPDSTDQYFEVVSWENADKYPADIILVDQRPGSPRISEFPGFSPTWSKLPAVKAGQTFEWLPYVSTSDWGTYATQLEALTTLVENAKHVT
jgi:iron complex transport system substrate-binding protein